MKKLALALMIALFVQSAAEASVKTKIVRGLCITGRVVAFVTAPIQVVAFSALGHIEDLVDCQEWRERRLHDVHWFVIDNNQVPKTEVPKDAI